MLGRAQPAADQVHAVRGPRLALIAVQRGHELGDVGRRPAPGQGEVRLEPAALVRRRKDAWLARQLTGLTAEERATLRAAVPILEKLSQS